MGLEQSMGAAGSRARDCPDDLLRDRDGSRDHLDRHPFNAKPKFSFRKAAEEPPQKVYLDAAAVLSGGTPVQPDRSETQHIADFPALAGSVSRASAPLRAPPSSLLAV